MTKSSCLFHPNLRGPFKTLGNKAPDTRNTLFKVVLHHHHYFKSIE